MLRYYFNFKKSKNKLSRKPYPVTCGKVKVEEGTQMHSEVKKFNRDKAEIIVRQAEVEIQVIRYITEQKSQGKRVVGESTKTMSIPENQTNAKHNRMTVTCLTVI